jgi:hypothetical protein
VPIGRNDGHGLAAFAHPTRYGPQEPIFDGTWVLPDIDRIE